MIAKLFLTIATGRKTALYLAERNGDAWRLRKSNREVFDIHADEHGLHCTCGDAIWRKRTCKHANALIEVGLLKR